MSWKESILSRNASSESDLSSLDVESPEPMPLSKLRLYDNHHSAIQQEGVDAMLFPVFTGDVLMDILENAVDESFESDDLSKFSVAFDLSDCESVGASVIVAAVQDKAAVIITPTAPDGRLSMPATPTASLLREFPSSSRLSAVKWSKSLMMKSPAVDSLVPTCLASVFAADPSGDPLMSPRNIKEINRYPYDLVSPFTQAIVDNTIDELFGVGDGDFTLDEDCFDAWDTQADSMEYPSL